MTKFEYKITKLQENGELWTHYICVRASDKLDALAKIEQMFPADEYEHDFIETC